MIFESRGLSWRHVASARLISTAGKALLLAGMVLLGPVLAMEPDDRFVGPFYGGSIAFGLLALAVSYAVSLTQTWSPRRFRVGDDALLVLGRSVPLRKIASAYVVERRIGARRCLPSRSSSGAATSSPCACRTRRRPPSS